MVFAAEAECQRVGVVFVAGGDRQDRKIRRRIEDLDIELVVCAPQHVLQIDGKLPFRHGAEADAPGQRCRERKFGFHDCRGDCRGIDVEFRKKLSQDGLNRRIVDGRHVDRAGIHLHLEFRTIGHAERPLFVDVPHDAEIHPDGHFGLAFETQRHDVAVACQLEDVRSARSYDLYDVVQRGVLGIRRSDGQHRTRKVEFTPRHHQAGADGEVFADFERHRRLEIVGLEVDGLHELRSGPIVAPVHRRTEGGVESQADRHPVQRLVVEIGVERGCDLVVRREVPGLGLARVVGQGGISGFRVYSRDADRKVELRALE